MKNILQFVGLAIVVAIVAVAIWLWTPSPQAFDRDAAILAAQDYDARIIRDRYGVPHIYGKRDADVAFGLAFAHAEDDIENIQSGRRFTRGEMGLASGQEGAITDYLVAALRARHVAGEKYESDLSADTRAVLEGYAAGINLFCAQANDACEPGFAPLTPIDIVSSYVARTPFYYGFDQALTRLFEGDVEFAEEAKLARANYLKLDHRISPGSNAIAVAPSRSDDGHTRLMVNSHQPFLGPTAWYEARLKSEEGWDMIGGLFPGTPLVSHGTSPNLGWAFTVNKPDLFDVFQLTVNDEENPTQYLMDGEWKDLDTEEITIRVKLWGPFSFPSKQTVRRSVHEPVFDTPLGHFAVSFAGDGNVQAIEQWFQMNKATNFSQWRTAMEIQGIPSFNIVYADKEGNIGFYYNAQVPDRSPEWDWSKVAPGDRSDMVWKGIRPFGTAAPLVENPASGYVVNSNHTPFESTTGVDRPKREDYPAHYGISDRTTNRGLRAQELFGANEQISGEAFLRYKMDLKYSQRSRLSIFLSELLNNPEVLNNPVFDEAVTLLSSWDLSTEVESRAAGLAIRTGQIAMGIQMNHEGPENPNPVEALEQAISEYQQGFGKIDPTWGEVNRLKRGEVDLPLAGGPDILRAIYSIDNPKDGSLSGIAGDSYIMYVDWDPQGQPKVQTIHQFGSATQDENSQHYADQTSLFANQEFRTPPMALNNLLEEATADYKPGSRQR